MRHVGRKDLAGNGGVVRSNDDQVRRDGQALGLDVDTCRVKTTRQHLPSSLRATLARCHAHQMISSGGKEVCK